MKNIKIENLNKIFTKEYKITGYSFKKKSTANKIVNAFINVLYDIQKEEDTKFVLHKINDMELYIINGNHNITIVNKNLNDNNNELSFDIYKHSQQIREKLSNNYDIDIMELIDIKFTYYNLIAAISKYINNKPMKINKTNLHSEKYLIM